MTKLKAMPEVTAIENEVRQRAEHQLSQHRLNVDYYRIRRKVAYPLPVRKIAALEYPVKDITTGYPWAIWLSWALEERIACLGWGAEWLNHPGMKQAALADLAALAEWPTFRELERPDLCTGHTARILWNAQRHWPWVDQVLRDKIASALERIVNDIWPLSNALYSRFTRPEEIVALKDPCGVLANIPVIGTMGAALAANAIGHPAAKPLNQYVHILVTALFDLHGQGLSEGAAYDGYLLDFICDWIEILQPEERAQILSHPHIEGAFEQSCYLSAPGDVTQVAELSDVEPQQMPFHLSAQAKLNHFKPSPQRSWFLRHCRIDRLRTDALVALRASRAYSVIPPPSGPLEAHYALVLRSGWKAADLAVAVAYSNSAMRHIHDDNGSVVIGSAGKWLITDPGYQQYMTTSERVFTLGETAHNAPVINGQAQTFKAPRRMALSTLAPGLHMAQLDLTDCYPKELGLAHVHRTVWLEEAQCVVIADQIAGTKVQSIHYTWHGHSDAAWWVEDGWAGIFVDSSALWMHTPQTEITEKAIDRLKGSRGQLSLRLQLPAQSTVWWIFERSLERPQAKIISTDTCLQWGAQHFVLP